MKKSVLMAVVVGLLVVWASVSAFAGITVVPKPPVKDMSWEDARPYLVKALVENQRIQLGDWTIYNRWDEGLKTNFQKAQMTKLWVLTSDGSYTDLVLPGISEYVGVYFADIFNSKDDGKRRDLCFEMLNGLLDIFAILDRQISVASKFHQQRERDEKEFLGRKGRVPKDGEPAFTEELWKEFVEAYARYAKNWPGFFSTKVEVQKEGRSYDRYHYIEIAILEKTISRTIGCESFSKDDFVNLFVDLTGGDTRLSYARNWVVLPISK